MDINIKQCVTKKKKINVFLLKCVFDAQNENIKELELENSLLIKLLIRPKDKSI